MLSPIPPPRTLAVYGWAAGLAIILAALLALDNQRTLFATPLYEDGDLASNSFYVREAKSRPVVHGHYSRWNFYHPGPVLFYVYAVGEIVFYDWLHAVPTPYNGQMLSLCLAMTLFFSLALLLFAQRLGASRGGWTFFLPLATLFAVWHYGAANVAPAFTSTWPACPLILTFLCFVVATASVASGAGRELPLVALTGGWLVHNYVAQPLFVVPMTLLAYGGLLAACQHLDASGQASWRAVLTAGWRAFPRAHLVAAAVLAVFILPLVLDALRGRESNLHRILAELRLHQEPMNKLARSLCYFLTFGGYEPYEPAEPFFGRYSAGGMLAFVTRHWQAYLGWAAVLAVTPLLLVVTNQIVANTPEVPSGSFLSVSGQRDTFLPWFGAMTAAAWVMTLYWGMKQIGSMFYFNAYFDFSIYFCGALAMAAALSMFLHALTAAPHLRRARGVISAGLFAGAGTAMFSHAASFQNSAPTRPTNAALVAATTRAAASLRPGQLCYLDWQPQDAWEAAAGVALQLDRLGHPVRVNENWFVAFGKQHAFSRDRYDPDEPVAHWSIVPLAEDPARLALWTVADRYALEVWPLADLDPASGKIRFAADGNSKLYACMGWAGAGGEWAWQDQPFALLQFRPLPLPADNTAGVDLYLDAASLTGPGAQTAQRVEIVFGDTALPPVALPVKEGDQPTRVRIPADWWRAASGRDFVKVLLRFPDARSPVSLGINHDDRQLGGNFRSIEFRLAP